MLCETCHNVFRRAEWAKSKGFGQFVAHHRTELSFYNAVEIGCQICFVAFDSPQIIQKELADADSPRDPFTFVVKWIQNFDPDRQNQRQSSRYFMVTVMVENPKTTDPEKFLRMPIFWLVPLSCKCTRSVQFLFKGIRLPPRRTNWLRAHQRRTCHQTNQGVDFRLHRKSYELQRDKRCEL